MNSSLVFVFYVVALVRGVFLAVAQCLGRLKRNRWLPSCFLVLAYLSIRIKIPFSLLFE